MKSCLVWILVASAALGTAFATAPAPESTNARIEALRVELARHDELYFRRAAPEITDAEYDRLKRELHGLLHEAGGQHMVGRGVPAEPRLTEDGSPHPATNGHTLSRNALDRGGDDRSGNFPDAPHGLPLLGLEKSYTESELRRFLQRVARSAGEPVTWVVEPKYDGLAVSLTYEKGQLVRALTRGDGHRGEDVTANLLASATVPVRLLPLADGRAVPTRVEVRGEVFLQWSEFQRINRERRASGDAEFAHPRNLAVGTLKSVDPSVLASRRLSLVAYAWGVWEPAADAPASQLEWLARLRGWGFEVPPAHAASGEETVVQLVRAIDLGREGFPGPLDGAVIKIDASALRARLGDSATAPRWAIAHKFEPARAETRLTGITLQVGRSGVVTPVAELEPVEVGGATIARASLHHAREIARRDYRVGDWVRVERAGEIVPQLVGVNLERRSPDAVPFVFPLRCPGCGSQLAAEGAAVLRCLNRDCAPQVLRRLEHAASPAALDLDGFGPVLIAQLVARGRLRQVEDFFALTAADVSAKLLAEVERSRGAELWRWIAALGLNEVGPTGARRLAESAGGLTGLAKADEATLRRAGLSESAAQALVAQLATDEVQATIRALESQRRVAPIEARSGKLVGQRFVFTGALVTVSRELAGRRVREQGGEVQSDVTRETDYLVAGAGGGKKLEEARRLGIVVLDETEFLRLIGP